jgi:hypothetical protein
MRLLAPLSADLVMPLGNPANRTAASLQSQADVRHNHGRYSTFTTRRGSTIEVIGPSETRLMWPETGGCVRESDANGPSGGRAAERNNNRGTRRSASPDRCAGKRCLFRLC